MTLTATPDSGSHFAGWSGGCTSQALTCMVTMNAAKSVTATFTDTAPPVKTWAKDLRRAQTLTEAKPYSANRGRRIYRRRIYLFLRYGYW